MSNIDPTGVLVVVTNLDLPSDYAIPVIGMAGAKGKVRSGHTRRDQFYGAVLAELDALHDGGKIILRYRDRYRELLLDGKTPEELVDEAERLGDARTAPPPKERTEVFISASEFLNEPGGAVSLTGPSHTGTVSNLIGSNGRPTMRLKSLEFVFSESPSVTATINVSLFGFDRVGNYQAAEAITTNPVTTIEFTNAENPHLPPYLSRLVTTET